MPEKTISGNPEMIRIAKEFTDVAIQAVNSKFGKTDCEMEGATLALRLLTRLLVDNGTIDRDVLTANGEAWIDIIKARTGNAFHHEGVSLVFAHILDIKSDDAPDTPPSPRFEVIKGGK